MPGILPRIIIFFLLIISSVANAQIILSTNWEGYEKSIVDSKKQLDSADIIPPYKTQDYDLQIQNVYRKVLNKKENDSNARIIKVSEYLLGKKYLLGALGEGPHGEFDQEPLYRMDAFDCTTFVETVLALATAKNLTQFQNAIKKIRYANGKVSFITRNHFTCVDWNKNNQRLGYIQDITDQFNVPYKTTNTIINKPNWYRTLPVNTLRLLQPIDQQETQFLVNKFRKNANKVQAKVAHTKYLPLTTLFINKDGFLQPNKKIFDKIPSPAIIEIVRSNYDLTKIIGTHLDVTHMGFAIRTKEGLMFRQASEVHGRTVDVPLTNYLLSYYRFVRGPERVGINIEKILEKDVGLRPTA